MNRQLRPRSPRAALTLCCSALGLVLLAPVSARAQSSTPPLDHTIDTQLFQPAIGPQNYLTVDGADVAEHKRLSFGLELNYQQRPYTVFTNGTGASTETHLVDNQLTSEITAAIGLFGRFQAGIGIPFTFFLDGDDVNTMGSPSGLHLRETGIGDLRIEGKAHLATLGRDDQYDVGLLAGLTLPTAYGAYLGDKTVTGRVKAIGTIDFGPVRAAANLGILIRETSHSFATELGPQLLYGAAADYSVDRKSNIILEVSGRSGLNQFIQFYSDVNPFEIDLAGRRALNGMWSLTGGLGRGIGNGIGAPDIRFFLMAAFNPDFRDRDHDGIYDTDDKCPDQPEDRDGFQDEDGCPDPDNDADGIPDDKDKCPNQPEDFDDFQDADGCPDLDNDNDGIPDLNDACPNAPEDHKGKKPNDGCPSSTEDSDGDGIPDNVDKCPDEPEDKDGFEDADGCPDPDNDADGIPDNFDNCPNAPEDHKGKKPNDGCPSSTEDSDGDGIPDNVDKCPDEPEDKDGFEDADGCPDPDNDADGIPDNFDNCPNAPEDADGFQDEDGCPDPDNDKDGIPDTVDKCPMQPETLNGIKDDDGCPDPGPEWVRFADGKLEVDPKLGFTSHGGKTVLRDSSAPVANDIALVMKGHPEILKLKIELYAPGVPKTETQKRADALKDFLVGKGVEAERIEAVGMGAGAIRIDFTATIGEPPKPGAPAAPTAKPPATPPLPPAPPATPPPAPGATPTSKP